MKKLLLFSLLVISLCTFANNPYRNYLLAKVVALPVRQSAKEVPLVQTKSTCVIPHYEIPKGNVFCRMEDKLTRSTGLWIKLGVK